MSGHMGSFSSVAAWFLLRDFDNHESIMSDHIFVCLSLVQVLRLPPASISASVFCVPSCGAVA